MGRVRLAYTLQRGGFIMSDSPDAHLGCIVDFCGNRRSPGHWADRFRRPDGSEYIGLGGDWEFYHPGAPRVIDSTDARFPGFLAAAAAGDDIAFVRDNWPRTAWTGGDSPTRSHKQNPRFRELRRAFYRQQVRECGGLSLWACAGTSSLDRARIFWNRANGDAHATIRAAARAGRVA